MDTYFIYLLIIGLTGLSVTWIPAILEKFHISYSLVFITFGSLLYILMPNLAWPDPIKDQKLITHVTEAMVIIAIMGTGLKIDRALSLKNWQIPLRLLCITMPLCIGVIAGIAYWALGFSLASSLLLGAVLAPTDPVLAGDVQVDGPNEGKGGDTKFSLTAEAGLNDGMAFPFVWLAILIASYMSVDKIALEWISFYSIYKIICGVILGYLGGRIITYFFFKLPEKKNMLHVRDGLVAISMTFLIYAITELTQGYGFIAVFITAITIRNYERGHDYHDKLHAFTDQVERILLALILIVFGGVILTGILEPLNWGMILLALGCILVIRPLCGYMGLIKMNTSYKTKLAISFLGIKGIGSFFYLSYALSKGEFQYQNELWAITACVVLLSIFIHGLTASRIVKWIE